MADPALPGSRQDRVDKVPPPRRWYAWMLRRADADGAFLVVACTLYLSIVVLGMGCTKHHFRGLCTCLVLEPRQAAIIYVRGLSQRREAKGSVRS